MALVFPVHCKVTQTGANELATQEDPLEKTGVYFELIERMVLH